MSCLTKLLTCLIFNMATLASIAAQSSILYTSEQGLPVSEINALEIDQHGYLWIGTNGGGLSRFDGRSFHNLRNNDAFKPRYIYDLARDYNGRLHIYTEAGHFALTQNNITKIDERRISMSKRDSLIQSPCGFKSNDYLVSGQGEQYWATKTGLCRKPVIGLYELIESNQLGTTGVQDIEALAPNNLCIATQGNDLYHYQNAILRKINVQGSIYDIEADAHGRFWIATEDNLYTLNRARLMDSISFSALTGSSPTVLHGADGDQFYMGTEHGMLVISMGKKGIPILFFYDAQNGFVNDRINDITTSKQGYYAATENNGIFKFMPDAKGRVRFQKLSLPSALAGISIDDIEVIQDRLYFLAANRTGIFEMDARQNVSHISARDGLKDDLIKFIGTDGKGRLWTGSPEGIQLINPSDSGYSVTMLSRGSGFLGTEVIAGAFDADTSGNLYFGTITGLYALTPEEQTWGVYKPELVIDRIDPGSQSITGNPFTDSIMELSGIARELQIHCSHVNLVFPDAPAFRYRTVHESAEKAKWHKWSDHPVVRITDLKYGMSQIQIQTRSSNGTLSESGIVNLYLKRPIWQQRTYMLPILALTILFLLLIYRWFTAGRTKRQQLLIELETLRKRTAELENMSHQLQVNPHFLSNALNAIKASIKEDNIRLARKNISSYARLMRLILNHSAREWVSLDEEFNLLSEYVRVSNLALGKEIALSVHAGEISGSVCIPPLVLQPFVENVFKHGMKGKRRGEIRINLQYSGRSIECTIKDDGCGIAEGPVTGTTYALMEARLRKINRYAPTQVIAINRNISEGFEISIIIPYKDESSNN